MNTTHGYDDLLLLPQYEDQGPVHRSEVRLPSQCIIASPMDTVSSVDLIKEMRKNGQEGVIHRYQTVAEQLEQAEEIQDAWVAIGDSGPIPQELLESPHASHLVIDIAHATSRTVRLVEQLRRQTNKTIIAGNVATGKAAFKLFEAGADGVRVGIGSGAGCSTRLRIGVGRGMVESVNEVATETRGQFPCRMIIADGGIRTGGDIAKAFALGANAVMCGSIFAGCDESPGAIYEFGSHQAHSKKYKYYRGMASQAAMRTFFGEGKGSVEGVDGFVPYLGSVEEVLNTLTRELRQACYYCGVRYPHQLIRATKMIQSPGCFRESQTRIRQEAV